MAQEDQQRAQSAFGAWIQLMLVGIISAGAILLPPLLSTRPQPSGAGNEATGVQDVDARLWQDPFEAAIKADKEKDKEYWECIKHQNDLKNIKDLKCTSSDYRNLEWLDQIAGKTETKKIVYALVPGGNAVGADESRRRQRYAVMAGMSVSGYVPDDAEHIGYVKQEIIGKELVIPYEFLSAADGKSPRALLLWVDEEALAQVMAHKNSAITTGVPGSKQASLPRLDKTVESLNEVASTQESQNLSAKSTANVDAENPCRHGEGDPQCRAIPLARFTKLIESLNGATREQVIIGPSTSGFLEAATTEICTSGTNGTQPRDLSTAEIDPLRRIRWYSPNATLPTSELEFSCNLSDGSRLVKDWDSAMGNFTRVIPPDNRVFDALKKELEQRRVLTNRDAIVLIGEWDTGYSRNLKKLFDAAFPSSSDSVKLIHAGYLRGLDGKHARAKSESESTKNESQGNTRTTERPEGDAQQDYLRRLDDNLKAQAGGRRIAAIGILGNDYHDKRLIVEELHTKFPEAVFFTTDLDASMLHPKDNKVMRNLVVAAGFGLELNTELQMGIPPFRNTYQTATFLATRMAMEGNRFTIPAAENQQNWWLKPQVFEIGRNKAIALPEPGAPAHPAHGDTIFARKFGTCAPHPCPPVAPGAHTVFYAPVGLLLILLVSAGCGLVRREWVRWWTALIVLSGLASWMIWKSQNVEVIEPLSWWQGVSIWPSELIRIIAMALGVALLVHGRHLIKEANDELKKRYSLPDAPESPSKKPAQPGCIDTHADCGLVKTWKSIWERLFAPAANAPGSAPPSFPATKFHQAWREIKDMCLLLFCSGKHQDSKREVIIAKVFAIYDDSDSRSPKPPHVPWFQRWPTWQRGVVFVAVYLVASLAILKGFLGLDIPAVPARGDFAFVADATILFLAASTFLALCFYALDKVSRAIWLAKELDVESKSYSRWPDPVLTKFQIGVSGDKPDERPDDIEKYYSDWLDAHFIAQATEPVQKLIFYPFVILSLMIIARTRLFDGWHFPYMLIIGFSIISLLLIIATFRLRAMAEKVREQAVRRLNRYLMEVRAKNAPYSDKLATQIEIMLRQVQELRIGAFAPIGQQPLFRAAMTVVTSLSGAQLLDHFGGFGL